jgi:hypothetical protein
VGDAAVQPRVVGLPTAAEAETVRFLDLFQTVLAAFQQIGVAVHLPRLIAVVTVFSADPRAVVAPQLTILIVPAFSEGQRLFSFLPVFVFLQLLPEFVVVAEQHSIGLQ